MVENSGIEPLTSCVQSRRSPSWANSPSFIFTSQTSKASLCERELRSLHPPKVTKIYSKASLFHKSQTKVFASCQSLKPKQGRLSLWWISCERIFICTLERRWSNRRFSYGYLVTTSPQSLIPLWTVASLAFRLRVKSTPMVWRAVSTRPGNVFTVAWLIYDY